MYNKLRRMREERAEGDRGFTLIELLVVVVIIGILVAIAIPLYMNYKEGAKKKSVESDVRNTVPLVEQYYAENNSYPTAAQFGTLNVHKSGSNTIAYSVSGNYYCVAGTDGGSIKYDYQSFTGKMTEGGTCASVTTS